MLRQYLFLLLLVTAGYCCPAGAQTDAADLERINAAIASVELQLAAARGERSALAGEIEQSEKQILEIERQVASVSAELVQQQSVLEALRAEQQLLAVASAAQQEMIAAYARSAWISGNEGYLKLMLNQEDPARSARMLRYYRYFSAARADKLAGFQRTLSELARVSVDIEAGTAALSAHQETLATRRLSLGASQQQRQALLVRLDEDVATQDAELGQLEMERIEIELLLQELQSSLVETTTDVEQEPFASRKGQLNWPLDGPHINTFGARHDLGDLTWEGITIGAAAGTDVRAIHHGRVVFADWFTTSGLLLIIDHGDGYMSLYAHNQELYKAVGEWVAAGDAIAAAGNTGGQRDASLYFEIRRNGRAENPVSWCVPR